MLSLKDHFQPLILPDWLEFCWLMASWLFNEDTIHNMLWYFLVKNKITWKFWVANDLTLELITECKYISIEKLWNIFVLTEDCGYIDIISTDWIIKFSKLDWQHKSENWEEWLRIADKENSYVIDFDGNILFKTNLMWNEEFSPDVVIKCWKVRWADIYYLVWPWQTHMSKDDQWYWIDYVCSKDGNILLTSWYIDLKVESRRELSIILWKDSHLTEWYKKHLDCNTLNILEPQQIINWEQMTFPLWFNNCYMARWLTSGKIYLCDFDWNFIIVDFTELTYTLNNIIIESNWKMYILPLSKFQIESKYIKKLWTSHLQVDNLIYKQYDPILQNDPIWEELSEDEVKIHNKRYKKAWIS